MSNWTEEQFADFQRDRGATAFAEAEKAVKPSKYRNVKVMVGGEKFDSKREAQYWAELKLREKAGEIGGLRRQVPYDLITATYNVNLDQIDSYPVVAQYICDFIFDDYVAKRRRIIDIKGGKETAMFALKRKWLFLQSGIEIEVVR